MEKENSLEKLKTKYAEFEKRLDLPEFKNLNNEFGIEKTDYDTDLFLKEIIKSIADKFQNYMRFIEGIINPSNTSIFVFNLVKLIDNGKRIKLSKVYEKISEFEVKLIKLDLESNEETEAQFINESYKIWIEIKKDIIEIIDFVNENWNAKTEQNKRDYFG